MNKSKRGFKILNGAREYEAIKQPSVGHVVHNVSLIRSFLNKTEKYLGQRITSENIIELENECKVGLISYDGLLSTSTLLSCQDAAARPVGILKTVNLRAAKQDVRDTVEPLVRYNSNYEAFGHATMSRSILPEGCRPVAYFCFCFNLLANVRTHILAQRCVYIM
uniref:Uncharacterized protein n=1 Tax=Glossina austeni TaxID=7395 RepID=A0A1A9VL04_GLOAU